jgi:UDP-N-acetylglucosamine acyltransferase
MIHATAMVHPNARLEPDVEVGAYAIIGDGVRIGRGTRVGDHARIEGPATLGEENRIHPFAVLGAAPQDLKYKGERSELVIGARNVFREFVTVHRGTAEGGGRTVIGSDSFLMHYSHVAHDCVIGNHVIMANGSTLAGHIEIQDHAIIGGLVAIHQFVRIGAYAMVGGMTGIARDIPPYTLASGARARLYGLNIVGLRRHGFAPASIQALKKAYRILFGSRTNLQKAVEQVRQEVPACAEVENLLRFIGESRRGVCR